MDPPQKTYKVKTHTLRLLNDQIFETESVQSLLSDNEDLRGDIPVVTTTAAQASHQKIQAV